VRFWQVLEREAMQALERGLAGVWWWVGRSGRSEDTLWGGRVRESRVGWDGGERREERGVRSHSNRFLEGLCVTHIAHRH
jgi:hypothetical protein